MEVTMAVTMLVMRVEIRMREGWVEELRGI